MATKFSRPHTTNFLLWGHLKSVVYEDWPRSIAALQDNMCCMCSCYPSDLVTCALAYSTVFTCVSNKMDTDCSECTKLCGVPYTCGFVDFQHFVTVGDNAMLFLYKYINIQRLLLTIPVPCTCLFFTAPSPYPENISPSHCQVTLATP
jgi:hypothetical protein